MLMADGKAAQMVLVHGGAADGVQGGYVAVSRARSYAQGFGTMPKSSYR